MCVRGGMTTWCHPRAADHAGDTLCIVCFYPCIFLPFMLPFSLNSPPIPICCFCALRQVQVLTQLPSLAAGRGVRGGGGTGALAFVAWVERGGACHGASLGCVGALLQGGGETCA